MSPSPLVRRGTFIQGKYAAFFLFHEIRICQIYGIFRSSSICYECTRALSANSHHLPNLSAKLRGGEGRRIRATSGIAVQVTSFRSTTRRTYSHSASVVHLFKVSLVYSNTRKEAGAILLDGLYLSWSLYRGFFYGQFRGFYILPPPH